MLGHGFHPSKAQLTLSKQKPQPVRPKGRTPFDGRYRGNNGHRLLRRNSPFVTQLRHRPAFFVAARSGSRPYQVVHFSRYDEGS
jgi:hypothetical protein